MLVFSKCNRISKLYTFIRLYLRGCLAVCRHWIFAVHEAAYGLRDSFFPSIFFSILPLLSVCTMRGVSIHCPYNLRPLACSKTFQKNQIQKCMSFLGCTQPLQLFSFHFFLPSFSPTLHSPCGQNFKFFLKSLDIYSI